MKPSNDDCIKSCKMFSVVEIRVFKLSHSAHKYFKMSCVGGNDIIFKLINGLFFDEKQNSEFFYQ